ncbi:MAG TPA: L,D-transpeptidase [Ktedonobacterales bacterium]
MSDREPLGMTGADAPISSSIATPVASTPRLRALLIVSAVVALAAVLVSSVFVAQGIMGTASLAPEISLATTIQRGAAAQTNSGGAVVTAVSCNCSSKHSSFAPSPYQPSGAGQVVVVSLSKQQLWAYQNGQLVMTSLVTTGMPQLPTPTGAFHIMMKETNVWFYSPWPYGSPYYYSPEHINYAMLFRSGGFYIHDAPWRETFGPGTNVPHIEPDGKWATGSHGCVNMPTGTAAQLYNWIGIGATVLIRY